MISLDIQTKSSSATELSLPSGETKSTLSFSDLLRGASQDKETGKTVQNGLLVLALADEKFTIKLPKQANNTPIITQIPLELNEELTKIMSVKDLKNLIQDAKKYLKNKILTNSDFKQSEIKSLPKTLKGLLQVAQKFNIDISKITLQEVQIKGVKVPLDTQDIKKTTLLVKETLTPQIQATKISVQNDISKGTKEFFANKELLKNQPAVTKEIKQGESLLATKEIISTKEGSRVKEVVSPQVLTPINEVFTKKEAIPKNEAVIVKAAVQNNEVIEKKELFQLVENTKKTTLLPNTPLFKAQENKLITTEQIVSVKINNNNIFSTTSTKQKSKDTLSLLLREKKVSQTDTKLGVDFSVATARVIAPTSLNIQSKQSLTTLLKGAISETETETETQTPNKTEFISLSKIDSFEVKLNEAKQMVKYISQDVKNAIEEYKAPFTRIKLQLNPQRLGEVDLTIVQRGKNLHINLSSNNVAINTLAMNVNDLKVQLSNSGINNASLNFSNNSQGSDSNAQQQSQHNQREAKDEYKYFENQEQNEELLSSLEIVVPHYA